MKVFRWKAVLPLAIFILLIAVIWIFLLDSIVRNSVEYVGSQITGARVDIESADVKLTTGRIAFRGIEAADPKEPMINMVQADEVIADIRIAPLLQKKVIVDTIVVRGVRFGTPRRESGALERKGRTTGVVTDRLSEWGENFKIPEFSLKGLAQAVNLSDIRTDSLLTVQLAIEIPTAADSLRERWIEDISSLDVSGDIETAEGIVKTLQDFNLSNLNIRKIREITDALSSAKNVVRSIDQKKNTLKDLRDNVTTGIQELRGRVESLNDARRLDYDYARGLLQIPSLDAPDIGPSLFGEMVREHIEPILTTLDKVEQYMPPGLQVRSQPGPKRIRRAGTTVHFPRRHAYPAFLLEFGEISLTLGNNTSPEQYLLRLKGLTSDPAVYGNPTGLALERVSGSGGDRMIKIGAVIDHTGGIPVDSLEVMVNGAGMGDISISSIGGMLDLGLGASTLRLVKTGSDLEVKMTWQCPQVEWISTADKSGIEAFVWDSVSSLTSVSIEVEIAGSVSDPHFTIESNVARELSRGLQRQLGDEIERAQARARAEVDQRIESFTARAQQEVESISFEVEQRVVELQNRLDEVTAELNTRVKEITGKLPPGIIPPA